jgi:hypothetical protein
VSSTWTRRQAEHLTSVGLVEKAADVDTDPVVAAGPPPRPPPVDAPVPGRGRRQVGVGGVRRPLRPAPSDAEAASKEDLVAIFGGDGHPPEPEGPGEEPAPAKRTVTRKS